MFNCILDNWNAKGGGVRGLHSSDLGLVPLAGCCKHTSKQSVSKFDIQGTVHRDLFL